jgi:hypothetical protein
MRDWDGRSAVWCKAPPGAQTILVMAAPAAVLVLPELASDHCQGAETFSFHPGRVGRRPVCKSQ